MKVAIIGGTGKLGLGLVARLLPTSHEIVIGSRDISKAQQAASAFDKRARGLSNDDAAAWCDSAFITIPYAAHRATLSPLKDGLAQKIIIDATVPLDPANLFSVVSETGKSAAEEAFHLLPHTNVFAAFQTISHRILRKVDSVEDVLVAGGEERKQQVVQLIREMNLRPVDAGPLEAARLLERMTALLISINKQNKVKESGLKVTGV